MHSEDATYETEVDAEIIGVGTITAFTIISPMILLAYSLYGRKAIQGTHLDILFCAVGAILFLTSGGIGHVFNLFKLKHFIKMKDI